VPSDLTRPSSLSNEKLVSKFAGLKFCVSNSTWCRYIAVYTFLAELFNPEVRGHLAKLKNMSPIDRETALLLMRNLSANLMCQRMWEDQIQLIGGAVQLLNSVDP
jgi:hypothetical protein